MEYNYRYVNYKEQTQKQIWFNGRKNMAFFQMPCDFLQILLKFEKTNLILYN